MEKSITGFSNSADDFADDVDALLLQLAQVAEGVFGHGSKGQRAAGAAGEIRIERQSFTQPSAARGLKCHDRRFGPPRQPAGSQAGRSRVGTALGLVNRLSRAPSCRRLTPGRPRSTAWLEERPLPPTPWRSWALFHLGAASPPLEDRATRRAPRTCSLRRKPGATGGRRARSPARPSVGRVRSATPAPRKRPADRAGVRSTRSPEAVRAARPRALPRTAR